MRLHNRQGNHLHTMLSSTVARLDHISKRWSNGAHQKHMQKHSSARQCLENLHELRPSARSAGVKESGKSKTLFSTSSQGSDMSRLASDSLLWMDEILHPFQAMRNRCWLVFTGESSCQRFFGKAGFGPSKIGVRLRREVLRSLPT